MDSVTVKPAGTTAASGARNPVAATMDAVGDTIRNVSGYIPEGVTRVTGEGLAAVAETAANHTGETLKHSGEQLLGATILPELNRLLLLLNATSFMGGGVVIGKMAKMLHGALVKSNPSTQLTEEIILQHFKAGQTEFLKGEIMDALVSLISSGLSPEEQAKLKQGEYALLLKAFGGGIYEEVKKAMAASKDPNVSTTSWIAGLVPKVLSGISKAIPYNSKIPEAAKPFAGAGVVLVGLWAMWKIVKLGFNIAMAPLRMFFGGGQPQMMMPAMPRG